MAIEKKLPLILRLFPTFAIAHQEPAFNRLLEVSGIVSISDNTRTLPYEDRDRAVARNQTWIREAIRCYGGGKVGAIFVWVHRSSLLAEASALNTLELFVREVRGVRKVLVVGDDLLSKTSFEFPYQSVRVDGETETALCYVLRLKSQYELDDGRRLSDFVGIRRLRREREDDTLVSIPLEGSTKPR